MARVFVSYAGEDLAVACEVRRWLGGGHHEVFLAGDLRAGIAAGEVWRSRLYEQLRWVDALVCVVTSASVASTWCTTEVAIAHSQGTRLIPIVAEPGMVHPLLSEVATASALSGGAHCVRGRWAGRLGPGCRHIPS